MCELHMGEFKKFSAKKYERRNKIKRVVTYLTIAGVSLGAGIVEAIYDTPCLFKPVLGLIPIASAMASANAEYEREYEDGLGVGDGSLEHGFEAAMDLGVGAVKGVGLSALCEGAGYGLAKLFS